MYVLIFYLGVTSTVPKTVYGTFSDYTKASDFVSDHRQEWNRQFDSWSFVIQEVTSP